MPSTAATAEGNALSYTVSVSNAWLSNPTVADPQLSATVPQGNPSLRLTVDDAADGIHGDMVFQLFQDLAPNTVDQIMSLVNSGFYDGLTFHRVIEDFMIQGGDPNGDGTGGPGFKFDDEFNAALQFTRPGLLAMANSGDDTNGSQFFVTVEPYRYGDFQYTIFGMITEGSDILEQINSVATDSNDKPLNTVTITEASIFYDTQNAVLRLSAPDGTTGTADVTVTATDTVTDESTTPDVSRDRGGRHDQRSALPRSHGPDRHRAPTRRSASTSPPPTWRVTRCTSTATSRPDANADLTLTIDSSTGHVTLTPANGASGVYSIVLGVRAAGSSAWDTQTVAVYVNPAAPTSVTLAAASDTGSSDSDGLTNLNNTAGKTLQFQVDGVISGADVQLCADGMLIGEATASGTSVVVTTNGTAALADGARSITATQTLEGPGGRRRQPAAPPWTWPARPRRR